MRKVGGHVSIAGGIGNAVTNAQLINANCLQIFAGSPRLWSRKLFDGAEVKKFNSAVSSLKLDPVFIHALYLVNLGTDNEELLKKSVESLVTDLKNGDQINSAGVVIHIGSHQGRGFESVKRQIVEKIKEIIDKTQSTPLLLECDAGQNGKIGSIEEISYLIDEVNHPRVGICLDTAHLFESGVDIRNALEVDKFVVRLEELKILDKVKVIHLNDSKTPLGSFRDMHENLGKGQIGLAGLKNFVNHSKLSHLPLILEVPGEDKTGPDKINIEAAKSL